MPRLSQFHAQHPDIELRLSAPDSPVEFPRDDIDVSIRVGRGEWPEDIVAQAFIVEAIGPVCSPALHARDALERPVQLRHHTLLHTETRPTAWDDWLGLTGVTDVDPTTGQRFETFYFLLQAAALGLGVAIAPNVLVADDLAAGRLVALWLCGKWHVVVYVVPQITCGECSSHRVSRLADRGRSGRVNSCTLGLTETQHPAMLGSAQIVPLADF